MRRSRRIGKRERYFLHFIRLRRSSALELTHSYRRENNTFGARELVFECGNYSPRIRWNLRCRELLEEGVRRRISQEAASHQCLLHSYFKRPEIALQSFWFQATLLRR